MAEARVTEVLLKLLAHPMDDIRRHGYKACLDTVKVRPSDVQSYSRTKRKK